MGNSVDNVILSIQNVCKAFPGVQALDNVSIDFQRGTVHGVVGENGAGKSTLMKILSGVYHKDAGTIVFDGKNIENIKPVESLQMGLSIIYQEFNLVNSMTVGENIYLGRFRELKGMKGTHRKAQELLANIGSDIDSYQLVDNLSVSEKQMVEIAKALSFNSKLIIMDEPSSSLTSDELKHLVKIIDQLKEKGITIIYISHKLDEIFNLCDDVTIMRDGHVIDSGHVSNFTRADMITKMIGRPIKNEYPDRTDCTGEVLLEIRSINTKKLKNISFVLRKGEILGLVGLVGAGRTEIAKAIFGADKIKDKSITINGETVYIKKPRDAMDLGIALVPEDRKQYGLVLPFTVRQNISMSCIDIISKFGVINTAKEKMIAQKHIDSLSIKTPSQITEVVSLSGGNQQKCVVGRWLEINPQILILDEPTRGIDVGTKYEIYLLMKKIAESGGSIIMISSELPEVLNMSNRVLTICDGKITGEFNPETITPDQIMECALGLEEEHGYVEQYQ